jgi:hypothetical protein
MKIIRNILILCGLALFTGVCLASHQITYQVNVDGKSNFTNNQVTFDAQICQNNNINTCTTIGSATMGDSKTLSGEATESDDTQNTETFTLRSQSGNAGNNVIFYMNLDSCNVNNDDVEISTSFIQQNIGGQLYKQGYTFKVTNKKMVSGQSWGLILGIDVDSEVMTCTLPEPQ